MPRQRDDDKLVGVGGGESRRHTPRRVMIVVATLAVLMATTAGCSSNSSSSTSTASSTGTSAPSVESGSSTASSYPAGKEQVCQARDQLKTSITALTDQSVLAAGTTAIKASVDQVQTDFDAVKTAAKQDYHAQVTDMQDALQQLQTAVGNLGNGDAAANLLAVGKAVTATAAAAENLFTQLKTACGS